MSDLLLGISSDFLYFQKRAPVKVSEYHSPYFLAFAPEDVDIGKARENLVEKWELHKSEDDSFGNIRKIGDVERYRSFWDFNKTREVFKVFTKKSYVVPEVSDFLFFKQGFFTAEHDIRYHQRALVDLAAEKNFWLFDTGGAQKKFRVLVYDIETSQYEQGKSDVPIDILGYASLNVTFESEKNVDSEDFRFDIVDCPSDWQGFDISQLVANTVDEEIDNLYTFCKLSKEHDCFSGHNILGFDNVQVHGRINWILKNRYESLSKDKRNVFNDFMSNFCRLDKSFHFGSASEVMQFYPSCFDTYIAARKFYPYLDDFSLKSIAPFLGILVKDRIILSPSQIKIDARTLKYNRQDIQEQLGLTLNLIQQALPLAFTTCMPFDMLLPAGAVNIWDHMALLRGVVQKKIMPPICRVKSSAQVLLRNFKGCGSKEEIVREAKKKVEFLPKDFVRVLKYGSEMPSWVEYPYVVFNELAKDADESLNYHFPGGMTIKPDKEAFSHFIPWYHVVVADVGAMYPTILKAMNIGADTVRVARKDEKADDWIWLKRLPEQFFKKYDVNWRKVGEQDSFADIGYIIGVKIDEKIGVVNASMTGILSMIAKIKAELKEAQKTGDKNELSRLKMMYQSMKGARNAGTHGILSAPTVSGRQFNLWGAAAITTKGQMILDDTLSFLKDKNIRVVYGDTDGIYLGCSRSVGNLPHFSESIGINSVESDSNWLTKPDKALSAIEECNVRWQKELNYADFELEPENHDAMVFVKHKNYLIFDEKNKKVEMITKGNNFKGSDKANIARKVLEDIMIAVLKDNPSWVDEEEARKKVKDSIRSKTKEVLRDLDLSTVDVEDLTLVQSVQPAKRYKKNQDGSISTFGRRSAALEKLLGKPIKSRVKLKFVVTKRPLPGIINPSKSGVKPIDFMYPLDLVKNLDDIDLAWYKKMIENYISGAFGLSDVATTEQKGLDAWM